MGGITPFSSQPFSLLVAHLNLILHLVIHGYRHNVLLPR